VSSEINTPEEQPRSGVRAKPRRSGLRAWWRGWSLGDRLFWGFVLTLLLGRLFAFGLYRIPTGSMLETLQIGDFIVAEKLTYGFRTPERIQVPLVGLTLIKGLPTLKLPGLRDPRQGDIIVFSYPEDRNLDYIKRCVAVAGDTVAVREGVLYVNGEIYESNFGDPDGDHSCIPTWADSESCPAPRAKKVRAGYLTGSHNRTWPFPGSGFPTPYVVPAGHIFMMGDNRYNSADSRYWGPLDARLIKGRAAFIYFSWDGDRHRVRLSRIGDTIR
jgi:signal peptidase I